MSGSHSRRSRLARAGLLALGCVLVASGTEARSITVRWRYTAPARAAGFRVHVGTAPGRYLRTIDVGSVTADAQGVYRATVEVGDDEPTYLAVTAYGERGEESGLSNETVRAPAPSAVPASPAPGAAPAAPAAPAQRAVPASPGPELGTPGKPRVVDE